LVLYLQSKCLTERLGFIYPPHYQVANGWNQKVASLSSCTNPEFLKKANFKGKTNLKRIENHRLEELIYQDVKIYGPTPLGAIHIRIAPELSYDKIKENNL